MNKSEYKRIEDYMLKCMSDSSHDKEHVYRVLYVALDIAGHETDIDYDVLIAACLLHDIGRKEQFDNPALCHAAVGADKAHRFLTDLGYSAEFAGKVASCVRAHRFRSDNPPVTKEEKILFDSDKIDVTGTLGIARTILYKGHVNQPLYNFDEAGCVSDGANDSASSFFQEYKFKLEKLYTRFYTKRGEEIALQRQHSAVSFYENMLKEVQETYQEGTELLNELVMP